MVPNLGNQPVPNWEILQWSKKHKTYDPQHTRKQWKSFKPKSRGAGTIFYLARKHGWTHASEKGVTIDDFRAYLPKHQYIFMPTGALWPVTSVDSRLPTPIAAPYGGRKMKVTKYLDKFKSVEQMTWVPGSPPVIEGRLVVDGGWVDRLGCATFNLFRPSNAKRGDATKAGPWIEHVERLYPQHVQHIMNYLAHRVQRPGEKINHALVFTGEPGIGKDTIIEPVKYAVGEWNSQSISPKELFSEFNPYMKTVLLVISEAHDLGDIDRYSFHERTKTLMAVPPNFLRCNEKHTPEHQAMNICGVVFTSNHPTDCLYLPMDDRRHHVAGSACTAKDFSAEYFRTLYSWFAHGGNEHVTAYLHERDLSGFDAKAPPEKTPEFWAIVDSNRAPEEAELADLLDIMKKPKVITFAHLITWASYKSSPVEKSLLDWLQDRKNRRQIPRRLKAVGYVAVRNPTAADGLWKINGKRQAIYGLDDLTESERLSKAVALTK